MSLQNRRTEILRHALWILERKIWQKPGYLPQTATFCPTTWHCWLKCQDKGHCVSKCQCFGAESDVIPSFISSASSHRVISGAHFTSSYNICNPWELTVNSSSRLSPARLPPVLPIHFLTSARRALVLFLPGIARLVYFCFLWLQREKMEMRCALVFVADEGQSWCFHAFQTTREAFLLVLICTTSCLTPPHTSMNIFTK